jgi:UDP-N-acetylmuramoyl-L-alanyl-D-glutamate--2,6-diaminopimelate ligase
MDNVKKSRLVQFFYNLPGVASTYHFLWAWLGARRHGHPSERIFVIGITGTKGKTTTLELLNAILEEAGKRTAVLSSLRMKIGEKTEKNRAGNSMPGRAYIQNFLQRALDAKCPYALIEVTSQGVVQHRHRFVRWNIGALTNLSPEHIESHGSFENYRKAKLDFLRYVLKSGGKVFLNRDDEHFKFFESALKAEDNGTVTHGTQAAAGPKTISYSREDTWLRNHLPRFKATRAASETAGAPKFVLSKFNEENVAVAVAIAKEIGIGDKAIEDALTTFRGVPGRMEFVTVGPYTAIVDYAHTPDSLRAAYLAAKPEPSVQYPDPHLICVLGAAGGGRDRWKRPEFGKIAAEYCDEIILTDEDPYDEDPGAIIKEVRSGILGGDPDIANVYEVVDRREAIRKAVSLMEPGDVVIGTGKGSEESIHVARGKTIPWNEKSAFEWALMEKKRA